MPAAGGGCALRSGQVSVGRRRHTTGEHYPDALRAGHAGSYLRGLEGAYFDPFLPELLRFAGDFDTNGMRPVELCGFPYYYLTPEPGRSPPSAAGR
jgi:hypothetical protein